MAFSAVSSTVDDSVSTVPVKTAAIASHAFGLPTASTKRHSIAELEQLAELDRWSLARQFRLAFGTSPSRFRTMRQLDMVRSMIRSGAGLADAALAAGFAD
jgi:AraC-like DNA-binding protein